MSVNGKLAMAENRLNAPSTDQLPIPSSLSSMDGVLKFMTAVVLVGSVIAMYVLTNHVDALLLEMKGWQTKQKDSTVSEAEAAKTAERAREVYIEQQAKLIAQQKQLKELLEQNALKIEEINRKLKAIQP